MFLISLVVHLYQCQSKSIEEGSYSAAIVTQTSFGGRAHNEFFFLPGELTYLDINRRKKK